MTSATPSGQNGELVVANPAFPTLYIQHEALLFELIC